MPQYSTKEFLIFYQSFWYHYSATKTPPALSETFPPRKSVTEVADTARRCRRQTKLRCTILVSGEGLVRISSWGMSVSVVSYYRPDDGGSIPGRGERRFHVASVFRPALRLTQPPV
jgi:hypothetical protein